MTKKELIGFLYHWENKLKGEGLIPTISTMITEIELDPKYDDEFSVEDFAEVTDNPDYNEHN